MKLFFLAVTIFCLCELFPQSEAVSSHCGYHALNHYYTTRCNSIYCTTYYKIKYGYCSSSGVQYFKHFEEFYLFCRCSLQFLMLILKKMIILFPMSSFWLQIADGLYKTTGSYWKWEKSSSKLNIHVEFTIFKATCHLILCLS